MIESTSTKDAVHENAIMTTDSCISALTARNRTHADMGVSAIITMVSFVGFLIIFNYFFRGFRQVLNTVAAGVAYATTRPLGPSSHHTW